MTRPDHTAVPPADVIAAAELYTCIGKGGEYELVGVARGAGTMRGNLVHVYRDTGTGCLFYRTPMDFSQRMARAEGAAPTAAQAAGVSGQCEPEGIACYDTETDAFGQRWAYYSVPLATGQEPPRLVRFVPSHAPNATLAASAEGKPATSGATSAAKVELRTPDSEVAEALAELLHQTGWTSPNDAQWSRIQDALPAIRRIVTT
jgi:hypothetical protein